MGERRIIWLVRRWLIDVFWTLWYPWIFLPMNIEWRIIENRVMQVNDSLSPPPVWKMYLCLCNHEEKSLYVYDWYSLIWFAHKYSNFQSHGHKTCPVPQITLLTSIMNYPLCMAHDLATVNRHDHAWTETWAQNICTLRKPLSLMRPWYAHRQGARRGHLCATKVKWKNYLACFPLLDMGLMIVLRRAGW